MKTIIFSLIVCLVLICSCESADYAKTGIINLPKGKKLVSAGYTDYGVFHVIKDMNQNDTAISYVLESTSTSNFRRTIIIQESK